MNTITFDKKLNCIINVDSDSARISFLINPSFSNTIKDLKSDIDSCQDIHLKSKLERFLNDLEAGKFEFMNYLAYTDEFPEVNMETLLGDDLKILPDDRDDGNWMATVHNIQSEHTGFWYAAMNIPREIQNIQDHIHLLLGFVVCADNIDEFIRIVRNSTSLDSSLKQLMNFGLSTKQALAILNLPLRSLTQLDHTTLTYEITDCTKLIEILNKYE